MDRREGQLAIAYFQTVSPTLSSPKVLHDYFRLLCNLSTADAFTFMRSQDDPVFFEILLKQALSHQDGRPPTQHAVELVDLPFTEAEQVRMYDYYLQGPGRSLKHASDVVAMRKIATGQNDDLEGALSRWHLPQRFSRT